MAYEKYCPSFCYAEVVCEEKEHLDNVHSCLFVQAGSIRLHRPFKRKKRDRFFLDTEKALKQGIPAHHSPATPTGNKRLHERVLLLIHNLSHQFPNIPFDSFLNISDVACVWTWRAGCGP